jgi:hypothetical protein
MTETNYQNGQGNIDISFKFGLKKLKFKSQTMSKKLLKSIYIDISQSKNKLKNLRLHS